MRECDLVNILRTSGFFVFFLNQPHQRKKGDMVKLGNTTCLGSSDWLPCYLTSASCLTRKEEMPSPTKSNPYHVNRHENHVLPFKTTAVCLSWRLTRHVLTCMWSSVVLSKRSDNKTKRSINFSITGKYVSTQMIWVWVLGPQHCKRLSEYKDNSIFHSVVASVTVKHNHHQWI